METSSGQFRIEYANGKNYEPDFVVEMDNSYCLIEPKSDRNRRAKVQPKRERLSVGANLQNQNARKNLMGKIVAICSYPHDEHPELSQSISGLMAIWFYDDY